MKSKFNPTGFTLCPDCWEWFKVADGDCPHCARRFAANKRRETEFHGWAIEENTPLCPSCLNHLDKTDWCCKTPGCPEFVHS